MIAELRVQYCLEVKILFLKFSLAPACLEGGGAARLPYNTALPALLQCLRSHSLFIKKINLNLVSPCYNQVDGRQQYIFQLLWPWSCRSKLKWRFIFFKVDFCLIFLQICFCVKINILKDSLIPRKSTIEIYIWKKRYWPQTLIF